MIALDNYRTSAWHVVIPPNYNEVIEGKPFTTLSLENGTQPSQQKANNIILIDDQIIDIEIVSPEQTKKSKDTLTSQAISHIERLNEIKDRLALSITQMAELFGVTRKSVYDWYEGAEPRSAVLNRMEILIDMLNSMPEIDLQRLKIVWNIPVSGQSFHSVFNNDNLELNALKEKINELSPRLVKKVSSLPKTTIQLGESHLAEFDRSADFT